MISNEQLLEQQMRQLLESQGFQIFKKIGHGAFGQVFLVHHPDLEEEFVAAKVIMNEDFDMNEWNATGILSQDRSQISPFIVQNILAKYFDKMTVILMEYSNLGTLFDLIKTMKNIPIPIIRVIMRQILQGLSYIHSKGIIHRDIKGNNILMHSPTGSGRVIADFGLMKNAQNDLQQSLIMSQRGTDAYMAPDLYLANANNVTKADSKVDIWSLGMLLYQITTHTFPYNPHNEYEISQFMRNRVLIRPPSITDNNLWNLLQRMLEFDRKVRISASEALTHPFFTSNLVQQEITKEQLQLAQTSQIAQQNGNIKINQFDINPNFIFPLIEVHKIIGPVYPYVQMAQFKAQIIPPIQQKQQQNQIINQPQINPQIQYNNHQFPINPTNQQQQLIQYQPISLLHQQQQQQQQQYQHSPNQQPFPNYQPFPIQPVFDNQYIQQQNVIIQPIPQINQYQPQIDKQYQPILQFPQQYQQQQFQQFPNLQPNITQPQLQVILPIQALTIEQLRQIPQDQFEASLRLFKQLKDALLTSKSINIRIQSKINQEIITAIIELTRNIIELINVNLDLNEEIIELIINSGLVMELINQIQEAPTDKIQSNIIETLEKISQYGSSQQTHQLYQMGIFQILSSKLKNKEKDVQHQILMTFIHVIKKGWKQLQQQQSTSPSQFHLQQLLSLPHPYLDQLEKQQIIITLIQDVILNNEIDMENKKIVCELLDILYSEGIKLPIYLKQQIIKYFCDQSKSDNSNIRNPALESLTLIAVNQDNHDLIIDGNEIQTVAEYLQRKESEDVNIEYKTVKYSLLLLLNLFLFGSQQTQQLIQNSISIETLNKIKNRKNNWGYKFYVDEIKYLLSSYLDPNTMNELIRIRRVVERKSEEGLIELIKAGLIRRINEIIEKSIKESEGEGKMIIIGEIIEILIKDNSKVQRIIIDETKFLEQYIHILKSISPLQIKQGSLKPMKSFVQYVPTEQQKKLFEMGIIQLMMNFFVSKNGDIRQESIFIILIIIKAGLDGLKEGQQHPQHQQFQSDGTILKLIQIFKDEKDKDILRLIAQTLSYLFKSLPLPPEIRNNVIAQLKQNIDIYELSLLAECTENHDAILVIQFEKELLRDIQYTLENLNLSLSILKYGSNINKLKIASIIKWKVQQLTNDEYIDWLGNRWNNNWNENKKQEIKIKAKELFPMLISIIGDKEDAGKKK